VELPMDADPVGLPGTQRVALAGVLDLDDLGAKIGELRADRVAGNKPRHVDDAHPVERTGGIGVEGKLRHAHQEPSLRWPPSLSPACRETKPACRIAGVGSFCLFPLCSKP